MSKREKLPMALTISRTRCGGDRDDYIEVRICDESSNIEFVTIQVSLEQFALALTNLSHVPCSGEVRGVEKIGKYHESKDFSFEIPKKVMEDYKNRKEKVVKIVKKKCPKGWVPDIYFDSQNSFFEKDGKCFARTTIRRWV